MYIYCTAVEVDSVVAAPRGVRAHRVASGLSLYYVMHVAQWPLPRVVEHVRQHVSNGLPLRVLPGAGARTRQILHGATLGAAGIGACGCTQCGCGCGGGCHECT